METNTKKSYDNILEILYLLENDIGIAFITEINRYESYFTNNNISLTKEEYRELREKIAEIRSRIYEKTIRPLINFENNLYAKYKDIPEVKIIVPKTITSNINTTAIVIEAKPKVQSPKLKLDANAIRALLKKIQES